jgi:hypothetical protein
VFSEGHEDGPPRHLLVPDGRGDGRGGGWHEDERGSANAKLFHRRLAASIAQAVIGINNAQRHQLGQSIAGGLYTHPRSAAFAAQGGIRIDHVTVSGGVRDMQTFEGVPTRLAVELGGAIDQLG